MIHIRQIFDPTTVTEESIYTVVVTEGYEDLTTHPSIVEHPEIFEIVDAELPEQYQFLNYSS
jgi:hypothetical protein